MQTRADLIACIGENVSKKKGLTTHDVCMACCDMCVASGLAPLTDSALFASGSSASTCSDWLAKKLLLVTGQALCSRRVPKLLWTVLLHVFLLCSAWLLPSDSRWRRTSPPVERLWACSAVCRSLLWLAGQYKCSTARKVGQLLEPRFRWVLWRQCRPRDWSKTELRACADELLFLQLQAVCPQVDTADLYGCGGQNPFVLYAWASRCTYYVGIASVQRKTNKATPGPTCRWLEHMYMCGLIRTHTLESTKLRYRLMRKLRPEDTFWLVCRVGPETRIRAMESFEIATRRPGCNAPMGHNPKATKVVSPARSRPPKHVRKPSPFVGPFDCTASHASVDKLACKMGKPKAPLVPDEATNFSLAYMAWVRKLFVLQGTCGPYDIYDPRLAGLLVRWCGSKGSAIDWSLVEKKWRVGCSPAALWTCVSFLKGRRARAMATRNVNRELIARNLPKTFGVTFKVPREACLRVVKRALVHAVRL